MKLLRLDSISKKLTLLVMLSVLPAMIIIIYSGIEQRRQSIQRAKQDLLLLTSTMAQAQDDISLSVKQVLTTLSLLPEIQSLDIQACGKIIKDILRQNPDYLNIALSDLKGDVLISGKSQRGVNLADRKHFQDALQKKDFAVGEYIISRVGGKFPAFPYAYPVFDQSGTPIAMLTATVSLDRFSRFHELASLPANSFVAITDHKGIRLYYYPANEQVNPIGQPIKASSWEKARKNGAPGMFTGSGTDGLIRMYAFHPIRLSQGDKPYLYVWAALTEEHIIAPANTALIRNVFLLFLATASALAIAWLIGRQTLVSPIHDLVGLTRKFAAGNLEARCARLIRSDEFGTLTSAFHSMADSLKQSYESLASNEARFRRVMDSLNALVYVADMESYEILFLNEFGRKQFGDIIGNICWQSLQKGQNGPCTFCTNKYLLDEHGNPGDAYVWEFQNTVTGRWYFINDRAINWLDGRIVRIEVATDITARKQAEKSLQESNEILEKVFSTTHFLLAYMDKGFNFLRVNKAYAEAGGQSPDFFVGKNHFDLYPDEENKTIFQQVTESGQSYSALAKPFTYPDNPDKGVTYWDFSLNPIVDERHNVEGVLLTLLDVTKAKKAEEERAALEIQLRQVHKMEAIGTLTGGIAHDFNNILTIILGNAELAKFNISERRAAEKNIDQILNAANRAKDLIRRLLTFSRQEKGEKRPAVLCALVEESMKTIAPTVPTSVKLAVNVPSELRNRTDGLMINADPTQIHQLLMNLCINAVDAMDEVGTLTISVDEVTATDESPARCAGLFPGTYEYLLVSDTGHGMSKDLLDKIFDPFFTTKEAGKGTGLGLSVVQGIIENHDGHMFVESEPGKGTSFHIYFPGVCAKKPGARLDERSPPPTGMERLLIVDDEKMVAEVGKSMLEKLGYSVTMHTESNEALELFKSDPNKFDLVITDQTMPNLSGYEMAKKMLEVRPDIPIILCTGYSSKVDRTKAMHIGIREFAMKPLDIMELAFLIRKVLARSEQ